MFFLGVAPSYANCVSVAGVVAGCNHHADYHRRVHEERRYNDYHHHNYPQYSHAYYH